MKHLWILVLLACLAGLEIVHELASHEGPGAAVCLAPEASRDAVRDALLQHLQSHR
jgi:hypothetical protein